MLILRRNVAGIIDDPRQLLAGNREEPRGLARRRGEKNGFFWAEKGDHITSWQVPRWRRRRMHSTKSTCTVVSRDGGVTFLCSIFRMDVARFLRISHEPKSLRGVLTMARYWVDMPKLVWVLGIMLSSAYHVGVSSRGYFRVLSS